MTAPPMVNALVPVADGLVLVAVIVLPVFGS